MRGILPFRGPKVNATAQIKFELTYYDELLFSAPQEGSVITCIVLAASWRRCDPEDLRGHPRCCTVRKISTRQKKEKRISLKICTSAPVSAA